MGDSEDQDFASDMTPIILAAHVNNYDILKLLLSEGIGLLDVLKFDKLNMIF